MSASQLETRHTPCRSSLTRRWGDKQSCLSSLWVTPHRSCSYTLLHSDFLPKWLLAWLQCIHYIRKSSERPDNDQKHCMDEKWQLSCVCWRAGLLSMDYNGRPSAILEVDAIGSPGRGS